MRRIALGVFDPLQLQKRHYCALRKHTLQEFDCSGAIRACSSSAAMALVCVVLCRRISVRLSRPCHFGSRLTQTFVFCPTVCVSLTRTKGVNGERVASAWGPPRSASGRRLCMEPAKFVCHSIKRLIGLVEDECAILDRVNCLRVSIVRRRRTRRPARLLLSGNRKKDLRLQRG
ncbi:hypothetical protein CBOM_07936 [Ceraceosorus bombacis]|uniref:Uncharacterized protein n=1 Tax=Ceraceosorus bombacis TaxID=401625 RepID=A0A0P1BRH3_9BASI|nr:hypothetical protein CBOM_07936 [Ceraceosorus bombacis]